MVKIIDVRLLRDGIVAKLLLVDNFYYITLNNNVDFKNHSQETVYQQWEVLTGFKPGI